jgi:cytochrome c-type biogenesis protein CcmH
MRPVALFATLTLVLSGLLAGAASPAIAADPAPKTTVNDVEDEVMCPVCGTLLELAESPQAKREKAYVARLVAEGRTKAQIKDALLAQYGPSVLALPEASGFDLSAYLVPILAILVAIAVLAISVTRWRRAGGPPQSRRETEEKPAADDAARLEADIRRYDL